MMRCRRLIFNSLITVLFLFVTFSKYFIEFSSGVHNIFIPEQRGRKNIFINNFSRLTGVKLPLVSKTLSYLINTVPNAGHYQLSSDTSRDKLFYKTDKKIINTRNTSNVPHRVLNLPVKEPPLAEWKAAPRIADLDASNPWTNPPLKAFFQANYVINSQICSGRHVTIVFCVTIRRDNRAGRQAVRETWGAPGVRGHDSPAALVFLLGSAKAGEDPDVQKQITAESRRYGDVIQGDYLDDYRNLTLKSLQMLQWHQSYCRQAEYILKADDDLYVNVPGLLKVLKEKSAEIPGVPFIVGNCVNAGPIRNNASKWYISTQDYNSTNYPRYVNGGGGYALTGSAAAAIVRVAPTVPPIYLEDVYVTGLCAAAAGVSVVHRPAFTSYPLRNHPHLMYYRVTAGHYFLPPNLYQIHASFMAVTPDQQAFVRKYQLIDFYRDYLNITIRGQRKLHLRKRKPQVS